MQKEEGDQSQEFMMEINNVSSRMVEQVIKMEKDYLSKKNSNSSHEMRNPMNAIKSEAENQEVQILKIEVVVDGLKERGALT